MPVTVSVLDTLHDLLYTQGKSLWIGLKERIRKDPLPSISSVTEWKLGTYSCYGIFYRNILLIILIQYYWTQGLLETTSLEGTVEFDEFLLVDDILSFYLLDTFTVKVVEMDRGVIIL